MQDEGEPSEQCGRPGEGFGDSAKAPPCTDGHIYLYLRVHGVTGYTIIKEFKDLDSSPSSAMC